jgi:predicted lipoprotein with Yx(FWY)xxD motif
MRRRRRIGCSVNRRRLASVALVGALSVLGASVSASGAPGVAKNLIVTSAVRTSLLDAGAAYHLLPVKDYVGLAKGMTYYALDVTTKTYYAAAGLDPSPKSLQAQVGAQDDGGYNLFVRAQGAKKWKIYDDGLGGAEGAKCPITIPPAVLKVWDWRLRCAPPQL